MVVVVAVGVVADGGVLPPVVVDVGAPAPPAGGVVVVVADAAVVVAPAPVVPELGGVRAVLVLVPAVSADVGVVAAGVEAAVDVGVVVAGVEDAVGAGATGGVVPLGVEAASGALVEPVAWTGAEEGVSDVAEPVPGPVPVGGWVPVVSGAGEPAASVLVDAVASPCVVLGAPVSAVVDELMSTASDMLVVSPAPYGAASATP
jgi:hypothetical protein